MILTILGYVVAAVCVGTYILAARGGSLTPNLWANLIGGPIVAVGNALVGYWPAVILEVFYTFAGLYGLLRVWHARRHAWDFKFYTNTVAVGGTDVIIGDLLTPYAGGYYADQPIPIDRPRRRGYR